MDCHRQSSPYEPKGQGFESLTPYQDPERKFRVFCFYRREGENPCGVRCESGNPPRPRREAGEGLRENWFARQIAHTEGVRHFRRSACDLNPLRRTKTRNESSGFFVFSSGKASGFSRLAVV